jgi:PAS domain S-box-containing protein
MSKVLEQRVQGRTAQLEAMNQGLRESEARYQHLLHSVTNYVYTVQLRQGQAVSTTHGPGCTPVTGYTPADYSADDYLWYRMIHEHDRAAVTQVVNRLLAGEVVQPLEHRIYHKDGSLRWIRHTLVAHFDHYAQLVAYDGLIEDITGRKQAEEALQRNQAAALQFSERLAVLQKITNQLSKAESFDELCRQAVELGIARLGFDRIGIWFVGERLGVANGSFGTDEHGKLRDERGATVEFGPDEPDWRLLSCKESVVTVQSKPLYNHLRRYVGEGERAVATLWDGDKTIGLIAVDNLLTHQPITEQQLEILRLYATTLGHLCRRKQAEDELRASEERYRALYRNNPSMFFTLNSAGIITSVNDFGANQLGYTKEQLEGQPVLKVFHEADQAAVIEQFNACLQNPWQIFYWQFRKVRRDGSILWVEEFARAVNGPGNTLNVLVVCNDITGRKAMEQALSQAHNELEARVAQRTAELEKANQQLAALYQVAQTITAQLELDVTLGAIARSAANLVGTDTGAILLLDNAGETLSIKGAHGLSKMGIEDTHDRVGESIAGRVVQTGQPIIANDLPNDPRFYNPSAAQEGLLACASVPLVVGERTIGTLDVYSKTERHAFTDTHIQILSLLASQAAIVIENARLYEAAQQEIIERKRVETTLQERNEQLKTLINAMPDMVVFKDGQGRYLETNDFNLRFFGLEGVDYRGKTDCDLAEFTSFYRDALKGCVETDEAAWKAQSMSRSDEILPRPDGPPRIFDLIKIPAFHSDGSRKGLVVVGRDVTERKQMEDALLKARAELEKRVEERTAALRQANDLLSQEIEERKRIEKGLRTAETEKTLLLNTTLGVC